MAVTVIGASAFAESRPSEETRRSRDGRGNISRDGGETRRRDEGASRRGDETRRSGESRDSRRERAIERRQPAPRSDSQIEVRANREERADRIERDRIVERTDRNRGDREYSVRERSALERSARERSAVERADRGRDRGNIDRNRDNRDDRGTRGRNDGYRDRSNDRHRSNDRGYRSDHRSHRQPYYHEGRVTRYHRHGNGYRVYIAGCAYPFFVPYSHWHHDRFRVGVSIRLGGWYNDLGYYDYYDGRGYSSGGIRGIVESVDYRRDTFVVRNDATGSFVTVVLRNRRDRVREGDYVELYGDWTRSGIFQAYDVDLLDDDRDYRRY
ncbi:MAG TPA: hypothetical protein VF111_15470 [Thermoanaerobaculia bacterium]